MPRVLTIVMAGGKGERLQPLTRERAKPAVPFGAVYRIVDFTLSNCVHSGLRQVMVLTQYKSLSLNRHLHTSWGCFNRSLGEYMDVLPPQQRLDDRWYEGTADAVYQNIYTIEKANVDFVLILSGDHIYRMDYQHLIRAHRETGADVTVACVPIPLEESSQFGVMQVDKQLRVTQFREKQTAVTPLPEDPTHCLGSMGVYVFGKEFLCKTLCEDAKNPKSQHDFGKNILPQLIHQADVRAYPFRDVDTGEPAYWRDVGTLDAYFDASMDLLSDRPGMNLSDRSWSVHRYMAPLPPPFIRDTTASKGMPSAHVKNTLLGPGTVITDAEVDHSILSSNVIVERDALVRDSIIFDEVRIGEAARVERAIVDKQVEIPAGERIGFDLEVDRARGLTVTESGMVVVPKEFRFERSASPYRRFHASHNKFSPGPVPILGVGNGSS